MSYLVIVGLELLPGLCGFKLAGLVKDLGAVCRNSGNLGHKGVNSIPFDMINWFLLWVRWPEMTMAVALF